MTRSPKSSRRRSRRSSASAASPKRRRRSRSASRSPAHAAASPKRRRRSASPRKSGGKKRLPKALQMWRQAIKNTKVSLIPKRGTSDYKKVKAEHNRLMGKRSSSPSKSRSPRRRRRSSH